MNIQLSWTNLKLLVTQKNILYNYTQEEILDLGTYYYIWAYEDGNIIYTVNINDTDNSNDVSDFETNYKSNANKRVSPDIVTIDNQNKLLVRDSKLDDIIIALGGQTTTSVPIQFNTINQSGRRPKKKSSIVGNNKSILLDLTVPVGKRWYISSWFGSGQNRALYEIAEYDMSSINYTLLDSLDTVTGWTRINFINTVILDTTFKYEGTGSLKLLCKHRGKNDNGNITKTYNPVLDLSTNEEISIYAYGNNSGKSVSLKLWQGTLNYLYCGQLIKSGWNNYQFSLDEILLFDKTAVSKIEIFIYSNGYTYLVDEYIWVDFIQKISNTITEPIDSFFAEAYIPYQRIIPTAISLDGGKHVRLTVSNLGAQTADFEIGLNGREVSI